MPDSDRVGKGTLESAAGQLDRLVDLAVRMRSDGVVLQQLERAAGIICDALRDGHKVLTCGNGGSATDASHLAEELIGRYRGDRRALAAVSLAADSSALTCIANDYGFEEVFARQVEGLGRKGDVLVAFTTSGNSPNILRALERARDRGMHTICFTGKSGGEALKLADVPVHIPDTDTARIQEMHTFGLHVLCEAAERCFGG